MSRERHTILLNYLCLSLYIKMKSFKEIGLSQGLLKVLEDIHFSEPSEIQEKVIPLALAGKDVIGGSATGSGKTLAFGAPIIQKIKTGEGLQALVLTPTRELAQQVSKAISVFSKYNPLRIVSIYGGVSLGPQINDLKSTNIVVGTPGRILDHLSRKTINLSKIKFLVLDEADRMLDMGFYKDVTEIIHKCPKDRQTLLFSATVSADIAEIARRHMNHPIEVSVESYVDPSKLEQIFYEVSSKEKFSLLVHLLKNEGSKLVMVFCNTKRNARSIGDNLRRYGFDAMALHGDLHQNKRNQIIEHFHKSEKFILVCTDVAARGLDIKNVSHIYNYDSPKTSTEYIHRIGRTARAGKEGKAITILSERDFENFRRVLNDPALHIKHTTPQEFDKKPINMSSSERQGRSRFSGNRGRGGNFRGRERSNTGFERGRTGGLGRDSSRRFGGRENRSFSGRSNRSFGNRGHSRGENRGSRMFQKQRSYR